MDTTENNTTQGVAPENQNPQGGNLSPTQGVGQNSSSNQSVNLESLLSKIEALEKDNKGYRDKINDFKSQIDERDKKTAEEKGEYQKLYHELKATVENTLPEIERYKKETNDLLELELKTLTPEQKTQFNDLFGDLEDPLIKYSKLKKWITSIPKNSDPSAVKRTPAQGKEDPVEKLRATLKQAKINEDNSVFRAAYNNRDEILKQLLGN